MTIWLSPEEAAERTPLSRKAIYGAIRRRELDARKRCGRWLIAEDELERWVASGERADRSAWEDSPSSPRRPRARPPARGSLAALQEIEKEHAA